MNQEKTAVAYGRYGLTVFDNPKEADAFAKYQEEVQGRQVSVMSYACPTQEFLTNARHITYSADTGKEPSK